MSCAEGRKEGRKEAHKESERADRRRDRLARRSSIPHQRAHVVYYILSFGWWKCIERTRRVNFQPPSSRRRRPRSPRAGRACRSRPRGPSPGRRCGRRRGRWPGGARSSPTCGRTGRPGGRLGQSEKVPPCSAAAQQFLLLRQLTRSDSASSAEVASSSSSREGFLINALAIATRCFWPPESCAPREPSSVS